MKIKKKKKFGGRGVQGEGCGGRVVGAYGGCERRIEVFVKIPKKNLGGGEGGRVGVVDVNEELKFL